MGEAELQSYNAQIIIHAVIICYGDAANDALSSQVAKDIADHWNAADGKIQMMILNADLLMTSL